MEEHTLPLDPTFSNKRNAKSPLPQHRSNAQSPIFALTPTIPTLNKQTNKIFKKKKKNNKNNIKIKYPLWY